MKRLILFTFIFLTAFSPTFSQASPTSTNTSTPTHTSAPTHTPSPTQTPSPTATVEISDPIPSPTSESPAQDSVPSFEDKFSGEGDSRFRIDLEDDFVGVIHVIGNSEGGEFMVRNYE